MGENIKPLPETPAARSKDLSEAAPSLPLDVEKYRGDLAGLGLSDSQELEFLQVLWSIMRSFVELGFDMKICGQIIEEFNSRSGESPGAVDSIHSTNMEKPSNGTGKASLS